jgi:hypothetical protein
MMGFAHVNSILRDNPDAAYYERTVGPIERDKVLLRWKLDDGKYQSKALPRSSSQEILWTSGALIESSRTTLLVERKKEG